MLNILANGRVYGGWTPTDCVELRNAVPANLYAAMDDTLTVEESDRGYGLRVCMTFNHGAARTWQPLSTKSALKVGDTIEKSKCFVTVLSKPGNDDIYRITETKETI